MKRGREFGRPGESDNDGKQRDFCWGLKLAKARDVCLRFLLVIFLLFVVCRMLFLCFDLQIQCCTFHRWLNVCKSLFLSLAHSQVWICFGFVL